MRETMPAKQAGRFAALFDCELPGFMDALQAMQGTTAARSLDVALHTASRTSEVLFAEWSELLRTGLFVETLDRHYAQLHDEARRLLQGESPRHVVSGAPRRAYLWGCM